VQRLPGGGKVSRDLVPERDHRLGELRPRLFEEPLLPSRRLRPQALHLPPALRHVRGELILGRCGLRLASRGVLRLDVALLLQLRKVHPPRIQQLVQRLPGGGKVSRDLVPERDHRLGELRPRLFEEPLLPSRRLRPQALHLPPALRHVRGELILGRCGLRLASRGVLRLDVALLLEATKDRLQLRHRCRHLLADQPLRGRGGLPTLPCVLVLLLEGLSQPLLESRTPLRGLDLFEPRDEVRDIRGLLVQTISEPVAAGGEVAALAIDLTDPHQGLLVVRSDDPPHLAQAAVHCLQRLRLLVQHVVAVGNLRLRRCQVLL